MTVYTVQYYQDYSRVIAWLLQCYYNERNVTTYVKGCRYNLALGYVKRKILIYDCKIKCTLISLL